MQLKAVDQELRDLDLIPARPKHNRCLILGKSPLLGKFSPLLNEAFEWAQKFLLAMRVSESCESVGLYFIRVLPGHVHQWSELKASPSALWLSDSNLLFSYLKSIS